MTKFILMVRLFYGLSGETLTYDIKHETQLSCQKESTTIIKNLASPPVLDTLEVSTRCVPLAEYLELRGIEENEL